MPETETDYKPKTTRFDPKALDARWTKYAEDRLKGRTILACRYLSKEEADGLGWYHRPVVIILDDGTFVFPSRDDEGNDGGAMFGQGAKGEEMTFPVL